MYMMVLVEKRAFRHLGRDEMALVKALISEESIYCLPGKS